MLLLRMNFYLFIWLGTLIVELVDVCDLYFSAMRKHGPCGIFFGWSATLCGSGFTKFDTNMLGYFIFFHSHQHTPINKCSKFLNVTWVVQWKMSRSDVLYLGDNTHFFEAVVLK